MAVSLRMPVWRFMSSLGILAGRRDFLLEMMPKGAVCAEIGVYAGDFSAHILKITQPKELHLIDPWLFFDDPGHTGAEFGKDSFIDQKKLDGIYQSVLKRFDPEIKSGRVVVHRATSEDASKLFSERYFDWVYIDGDHVYDAVRNDLELFHRLVKPNGIISGDDYCVSSNYQKEGVKKAVDEFGAAGRGAGIKVRRKQYIFQNVG